MNVQFTPVSLALVEELFTFKIDYFVAYSVVAWTF